MTHFIQLPAFRKKHEKNFKTHDLERWLTFLTQEIEEKEWEELVLMDKDISKAYDQIKYLLSDEEIVQIAEARERQLLDYNSALEGAREKGIEQGLEQGILKVAKKMIPMFSDEEIIEATDLDINVIKELRKELE